MICLMKSFGVKDSMIKISIKDLTDNCIGEVFYIRLIFEII